MFYLNQVDQFCENHYVSMVTDDKPHAAFKEVPFPVGSYVIHEQKTGSWVVTDSTSSHGRGLQGKDHFFPW